MSQTKWTHHTIDGQKIIVGLASAKTFGDRRVPIVVQIHFSNSLHVRLHMRVDLCTIVNADVNFKTQFKNDTHEKYIQRPWDNRLWGHCTHKFGSNEL